MTKLQSEITGRKGKHEEVKNEALSAEDEMLLERMLGEPEPDWDETPDHSPPGVSVGEVDLAKELGLEMLEAQDAGELIALAKALTNLSQRQIAERVGVSNPRVAQIQKAGQAIEVQTLERFARALGYNLELRLVPKQGGPVLVARANKESA